MDEAGESLPGPESVASVIFKAATDGSEKLRYPVKTQGASLLHGILPEQLWRTNSAQIICHCLNPGLLVGFQLCRYCRSNPYIRKWRLFIER